MSKEQRLREMREAKFERAQKVKRGRPRIGEKRVPHEPWKELGISERTYWRRQKEKAK